MTLSLVGWQARLEAHFTTLAASRAQSGLPVFALEHGLDSAERSALALALNESLGVATIRDSWLAWVVYASEQGYDYDGDEFWSTFEKRTPNWRYYADRRWLRNWFKRFHERFRGLKPSGPWASWFSIIAWPITHALLPRDLQSQLARALYQARFQLAQMLDADPADIGRYLARASDDGSSRFRNFLEQEDIVGRIVLALLSGRAADAEESIHPITFDRIVGDLQKAGAAKAWLQGAQQAVRTVQLKGAGRQPRDAIPSTQRDVSPAKPSMPEISPSLVLRRAGTSNWTVTAEFPSLQPLADLSTDIGVFLRRNRCTVAGSEGSLPAGWLMLGAQRRVLTSWPDVDQPLVRFENAPPLLSLILTADGKITTGPHWLFRVGPDGLAREIIGRMVRPGRSYILVERSPFKSPVGTPVTIASRGVYGLSIDLPAHLSPDLIGSLRDLGIGVSQAIHIAPAGLDARRWDGEGFGEWIDGETPCLAIWADHAIDRYDLKVDNGLVRTLKPTADRPLFIKLTDLEIGAHTVTVVAHAPNGDAAISLSGFLRVVMRPANPWVPGAAALNGMIVTSEPQDPSLDELRAGEVRLQAVGPLHHPVSACLELMDGAGHVTLTEQIAKFSLPITDEIWTKALNQFLATDADPWASLSAASGSLVVDGDVLGTWRIPLRRETAPIRWVWHRDADGTELRLTDDHGAEEAPAAEFYGFDRPSQAVELPASALEGGFRPSGQGGLCVVRYSGKQDALVVSMPVVEGGFAGLVATPQIPTADGASNHSATISHLLGLWSRAKLVGPLASPRRAAVVVALQQFLLASLCGSDWARAEREYLRSNKRYADLKQLASKTGVHAAVSFVLVRDLEKHQSMTASERRIQVGELARRYSKPAKGVIAAAMSISRTLGSVADESTSLEADLQTLGSERTMLRIARLLEIGKPAVAPAVRQGATFR